MGQEEIKIGVYDNREAFLGYKSTSWWEIDKDYFTKHNLEDGKIEGFLISNLLRLLNNQPTSRSPNLDAFLKRKRFFESLVEKGGYFLVAAMATDSNPSDKKWLAKCQIVKKKEIYQSLSA